MDDSAKSGSRLEVSISFGRFENDALSWEKWSSFSPNKYLEEVGNLSTPGSVAQKKAYFEAHYKKIAARKAEELEQEQLINTVSPILDMSRKEDHTANSSENDIEFSASSDERLVGELLEETCVSALTNVVIPDEEKYNSAKSFKEDEPASCTNDTVDNVVSMEEMSASVAVVPGSCAVQEATGVADVNVDKPKLNVSKVETPQDSQQILKEPPEIKNGFKQSNVLKKENSKLNSRNIAQKVTPNKERNLSGTRKKVVSSPSKPLPTMTPKHAKPTSISKPISDPQSLKKKVSSSAPPKIKSSQVVQNKRVAPTSLHMSLSLGPDKSMGALPMTRKSLIMESMGDKDIVKRAFKTFLNRSNGFATDDKPTTVKHVSTASCDPKTPDYHTPKQGNAGLRKNAEKIAGQRSHPGTRSNSTYSGLRKTTALDKKTPTTLSPATGLRSDEKAERRKELVKKLGAKSITREAENAYHGASAKSKVSVKTRSVNNDLH